MKDMSPLDSWLNVPTWHTLHPNDDERFYKAVYQLISINTKTPEPEQVRDYIMEKKEGSLEKEFLDRTVEVAVGRYDAIFSFLYENRIKL